MPKPETVGELAIVIAVMQKKQDNMQEHIDQIESDSKSQLKAGVSILGAALLAVLGFIWANRVYLIGGGQ